MKKSDKEKNNKNKGLVILNIILLRITYITTLFSFYCARIIILFAPVAVFELPDRNDAR